VRANAIAPGVIWNEFLSRIYPPGYFESRKDQALLGRLGEPAEVASLALFLASDESAYITGEIFCISGGSYVRA
jgi:3-oxoacyl-[acyl-carrier protein] reductase